MSTKLSPAALVLIGCLGSLSVSCDAASTGSKECLEPGAWYTIDERPHAVSEAKLLGEMAPRDVVLLGEQHDEPADHQWQLQTLSALHMLRPHMVIGFESFPRRTQPILDRWVAGELSAKQFFAEVQWEKIWNYPTDLYLPLFQFARINRIPMIALNVDRTLPESIASSGWDAVPAEKKEGVSRPAPAPQSYRAYLSEVFSQHEKAAAAKKQRAGSRDRAREYFIESQLTWDRAMAEALASALKSGDEAPLVVGIMGSGHVRQSYGVPHQLRDLGVSDIGTLLPIAANASCSALNRGYADAVFALPRWPGEKPPPPRLGVRLETTEEGVKISEVAAGSLAEKTGLKAGDRIVTIAGRGVTEAAVVVAAVRAQPAGTWLPVTVRREGDTLELVVKFPPRE